MNLNLQDIDRLKSQWKNAQPFNHIVIDNFLPESIAKQVADEFPDFNSDFWYEYQNPLEIKKACSDWNKFPASIYKVFLALLSQQVAEFLSRIADVPLHPDYGLHGGGLHTHKSGGKLNTHLDYSIHPKADLQRKINVILYVSEDWDPSWNGSLGLWSHDCHTNQPRDLVQNIECKFNRAVIFDTTMNSWHGLPNPITCPEDRSRNSLAVYYLCEPSHEADTRAKALYAPSADQRNDAYIADLIKKRANIEQCDTVYRVRQDASGLDRQG